MILDKNQSIRLMDNPFIKRWVTSLITPLCQVLDPEIPEHTRHNGNLHVQKPQISKFHELWKPNIK